MDNNIEAIWCTRCGGGDFAITEICEQDEERSAFLPCSHKPRAAAERRFETRVTVERRGTIRRGSKLTLNDPQKIEESSEEVALADVTCPACFEASDYDAGWFEETIGSRVKRARRTLKCEDCGFEMNSTADLLRV